MSWFSIVYKGLILTAIITFIISFFTEGKAAYGAEITGYSILIIAVMMVVINLFVKILNRKSENKGTIGEFFNLFLITLPFILMLITLIFVFYLLIYFKDKIMGGNLSPTFYSFNNINLLLVFIEIYILYTVLSEKNFENTGQFPKIKSNLLLLIAVLSIISTINVYIILKYFTTDGFTSFKI
jgi:hypothetical protein